MQVGSIYKPDRQIETSVAVPLVEHIFTYVYNPTYTYISFVEQKLSSF